MPISTSALKRQMPLDDLTVEQLETAILRAANCAYVTLPAHQLTPLLDLALRAAGTHSALTIKRLQRKAGEVQVQVTGDEIRMILDLALCAKLRENSTGRV